MNEAYPDYALWEQIIEKGEMVYSLFWDTGAILTQLHYRTVMNKFLVNNDQLTTGVLARAIQLGVQDGAFGLVAAQNGEIIPDSLKFKQSIPFDAVPFDGDTFLLTSARCEAILAACKAVEGEGVTTEGRGEEGRPKGGFPGGESVQLPVVAHEGPAVYHRFHLMVSDIPASKIADVNRGTLLPLNRAVGDIKFTIEIDVSSEKGISQATLENQIKEPIRRIGGRVVEERLE